MSFGTPSPFDAMLYGDEAAQRLGEERARKALAEDIAREQRRAGLTDGPTVDTSRMQLPIGKPTPMEETLYGRQDAQRIANERARKQFAEEIVREQVRRAKAHAPRPPAASSSPAPRPTPRPTPRPAPPPRPQGELDAELLRKAERANLPTWIRTAGQARHYQRIGTTAPAASAERLTSFDAFVAGLPAGSTLRDALASLGAEQEAAAYDAGLIAAPRLPAVGYTGLAVWTAVGLGSAWLYDWGLWLVLLLFVASSVAGSLVDREPNGVFTFGGFFGLTLVVAILRFTLGVEHPLGPVLTALAGMSLGGIIWYGHGVPGREREMARKAAEARVATRTQSIAAREAAL